MPHKPTSARIIALGRACGIAPEYWDNFGQSRRTSPSTYRTLLSAMGIPWEDPDQAAQELARRRLRPFDRLLEPVQVALPGSGRGKLSFYPWSPTPDMPPTLEVQAELIDEDGTGRSWKTVVVVPPQYPRRGDQHEGFRSRVQLPLPAPLEMGYYDLLLRVRAGGREEEGQTRVIAAPRQAFLPPWHKEGRRVWGLNVPLYALKSEHNWGMGDFTDLQDLTQWAGDLGAAFVGVNPLHAPSLRADADPSPYAPTSRLFTNFLYLDLEKSPELPHCSEAQAVLACPEFQGLKVRLQAAALVDYPEVYRLKRQILGCLSQTFLRLHGPPEAPITPRGQEFARFRSEKGPALVKFGQYAALAEFFGEADWRDWPLEYRQPDSPGVAALAREHAPVCLAHQYGQWLAAGQLDEVRRQARSRGLPFSLYQDLALGAAPGGFDTWANQELFAQGAAMGAPPDAFNPKGQNWGLPPLIPERLRESGYRFFMDTLRANLPPGGMLRLDHVMALFRLFWIPPGLDAAHGAYVRYRSRELLAILALESARAGTLIIGEDLGTVAPHIRRDLHKTGVLSYRVFFFERAPGNRFRPPEDYPPQAVAAVTTHDLPTLTGYWQETDIDLKRSLNLYPQPWMGDADAAARAQDRALLVDTLQHRGLLPGDFNEASPDSATCPARVREGVLEYLAQSRAGLLEVRLEEIFGLTEQQNLPGTVADPPNWRRKLPVTLKEMRLAPEPPRLAMRLNKYRGRDKLGGGSG